MAAGNPVFISYSRKDYYFAESLALHLSMRGIPVWLDVKDLTPGSSWDQDLEAALDRAPAMVLVASQKSWERPDVRKEWERAKKQGKRIIVAQFRSSRLPNQLVGESVDFRRAFGPSLEALISLLGRNPASVHEARCKLIPLSLPPWVLAILLTLLIPSIGYGLLGNWTVSEPDWSPAFEFVVRLLLPAFAFWLAWFFCFSFVRRRMGMTRLVTCLACLAVFNLLPLALYWAGSSLAGFSANIVTATTHYWGAMSLLGAVPLAGLAIVLLIRPEDLLRWTPTGKAWNWYRAGCGARLELAGRSSSALKQVRRYHLFHDSIDRPAANELRRIFTRLGAKEAQTGEDATAVLLLTNRTRHQALIRLASESRSTVLTLVGSSIGLPESLDWLWRHQWVDFRRWDVKRFDDGLLPVPEAVTGPRFPARVRFAHHLLCALAAMIFLIWVDNSQSGGQMAIASSLQQDVDGVQTLLACFACIWCGVLARRLLLRTVSEAAFFRSWLVGMAATAIAAAMAFPRASPSPIREIAILTGAAYLAVFPFLMVRSRRHLAFWFPSPERGHVKKDETLTPGRNWQTLLWVFIYAFFWVGVRGGY
jgi:hypothetical protein